MKIYCITDNQELEVGLKLAGCEAITLEEKNYYIRIRFDEKIKALDYSKNEKFDIYRKK